MPKAGDRIIIEGTKLGQVRREGELLGTVGSLMKVRWSDGSESLFSPGAGSFQVLPGRGKGKANGKKTPVKQAKKPAVAKPAVAKKVAKKPAAARKAGAKGAAKTKAAASKKGASKKR